MPRPTSSLATLRPDLGGSMEEFDLAADRAGFIGLRVLPVFQAAKQASTFGIIPIEQLLQKRETVRAAGAGYSRGKWKFEAGSYATIENGAEEPVDDREAAMYADYFDAEMVSAERARDVVLRNLEQRAADLVFNAVTFSAHAVTNEWDDLSNATPINDVEASVMRIWAASGLWPNALIVNRSVFRDLRNCEQIIDRINSAGAGNRTLSSDVTAAMLARCFDLEEVIVAGSPKNTADNGQTPVIAPIWSNEYAMVARIVRTNDIREPGLGRTIHWAEDGSEIGAAMETYRDESVRSDIVRARMDTDEKLLHTAAADLLSNITT